MADSSGPVNGAFSPLGFLHESTGMQAHVQMNMLKHIRKQTPLRKKKILYLNCNAHVELLEMHTGSLEENYSPQAGSEIIYPPAY